MHNSSFRIGYSIASYVLFAVLALIAKKTGFLAEYLVWGILLLLSLVLRDMLAFFGMESEPQHSVIAWSRLWSDFRGIRIHDEPKKSSATSDKRPRKLESLLVANRLALFPTVLSAYLLFLFFRETDVFSLATFIESLGSATEYALLGICVASGILTVFRESADDRYVSTAVST